MLLSTITLLILYTLKQPPACFSAGMSNLLLKWAALSLEIIQWAAEPIKFQEKWVNKVHTFGVKMTNGPHKNIRRAAGWTSLF